MTKVTDLVHYWPAREPDAACGRHRGLGTHVKADVTCKRCQREMWNCTVQLAADAGMEAEGKWVTVCETHNTLVGSSSKAGAEAAARYPEFCDECRAEMEGA